jgi:hypothetical protein
MSSPQLIAAISFYVSKPWQPLNVLVVAEALES